MVSFDPQVGRCLETTTMQRFVTIFLAFFGLKKVLIANEFVKSCYSIHLFQSTSTIIVKVKRDPKKSVRFHDVI